MRDIQDPIYYGKVRLSKNFYLPTDRFILLISAIIAIIIFFIGISLKLYESYINLAILILATYLLGVLPYIIYKSRRDIEIRRIIDAYPSFLNDLGEAISSGMTLLQAMKHVSNLNYGPLSKYIKKLYVWLSWNIEFEKAFEMFNQYFLDIPTIQIVNKMILQSYISGGDFSKTLKTVAIDLLNIRDLEKLRDAYISQQKMVMYVVFFIFLGLIVAILIVIQPIVSSFSTIQASSQLGITFGSTDLRWLKIISSIAIIMQAISIAIIIGITESGRIISSFKHLGITSLVSIIIILIFLLPPSIQINLSIYPTSAYIGQSVTINVEGSIDAKPINNELVTIKILGPTTQTFTAMFINGKATVTYTPQIVGNYTVEAVYIYSNREYKATSLFRVT